MAEFRLKSLTSLSLAPGQKQEVEVEGIEDAKVILVNTGGTVKALGSKCTHYGAPLIKGVLTANGRLTCPWHGGMSCPTPPRKSSRVIDIDSCSHSLLQRKDG